MRLINNLAIVLVVAVVTAKHAAAEIMTFTVNVTQTSINLGQSVDWQILANVTSSTASNFGIASITANLTDSFGNTLAPGTVGAPFTDYFLPSGGTWDGSSLIEIGGAALSQNISIVEAADPVNDPTPNLGPLLLASGSFTPTSIGLHTLTATAGSSNTFFTASGQAFGVGDMPFTMVFNADTFTVTAASVPEPSSVLLLTAATGIAGAWRVRSRKKAQCRV